MLLLNTGTGPHRPLAPDPHDGAEAARAVWIDLVSPTDAERLATERTTGLRVPSHAELSEVESSSRLSTEGGAVCLSTPMSYRSADGVPMVAPLGFVLSPRHLLTVRFAELPVFDLFADRFAHAADAASADTTPAGAAPCSTAAFVGLLEAIVDRLADVLERVGNDLDALSRRVFRPERQAPRRAARVDAELRATLREVGRAGDLLSNIRDSLLGVNRIVLYVPEAADAWLPRELRPRFKTLRQDLVSLADYDTQLTNKVQFLLDATLGFISIEQNNGIKVLTVVSVVGVPPTLMASIYGMNFQHMPELGWQYGYPYGLVMIVLSVHPGTCCVGAAGCGLVGPGLCGPSMWTAENRARYDRSKLRYPSDLTDEEWALVAPLIPPAKRGGNKRTVDVREVVNGLMYILSTGCQWAALPKDLPPRSTVHDYFARWDWDGTLGRIHHVLYVRCRELAGREASPTAAIIDSQGERAVRPA